MQSNCWSGGGKLDLREAGNRSASDSRCFDRKSAVDTGRYLQIMTKRLWVMM